MVDPMTDEDLGFLRTVVADLEPYEAIPGNRVRELVARLDAVEAERDRLRAENEMLCLHGAEPTDEEWALLRAERDRLRDIVREFLGSAELLDDSLYELQVNRSLMERAKEALGDG